MLMRICRPVNVNHCLSLCLTGRAKPMQRKRQRNKCDFAFSHQRGKYKRFILPYCRTMRTPSWLTLIGSFQLAQNKNAYWREVVERLLFYVSSQTVSTQFSLTLEAASTLNINLSVPDLVSVVGFFRFHFVVNAQNETTFATIQITN